MGRLGTHERVIFLAIKAVCYRGLGSAELLAFVGERLGAATRADATCMLQLDPATALPVYAVSQGWDADDHRVLAEYVLLASATADPGRLLAEGRRSVVVDELISSDRPYDHDPYFAYHLLPRGFRHELQTVCLSAKRGQALLTVTRRAATGAFEPRHLRLLDAVAPHVAAGIRAATIRASLAAPRAADTGFIVLDTLGNVSLANAIGEHWLAVPDAPGRPGRLWALHVVAGLLARSLTEEDADQPPEFDLADPATGALHRLRAERAIAVSGDPCTIILLEPITRADRPEALLRLGLTPREAEVTLGILRGAGPQMLARELGVSPHTIIQHRRNVFTKLDVSSRRELMLRLSPGF
jgi:DNA-binding CsgD family transcriptional regulator